jgi:hypothetical protein
MENLEEIYENLYDFVKNLEILIQKNIFNNQQIDEIHSLGNEIITLCKSKEFNLTSTDLKSLNSFNELLIKTPDSAKGYLIEQVENFYTNIIEPTKDELY